MCFVRRDRRTAWELWTSHRGRGTPTEARFATIRWQVGLRHLLQSWIHRVCHPARFDLEVFDSRNGAAFAHWDLLHPKARTRAEYGINPDNLVGSPAAPPAAIWRRSRSSRPPLVPKASLISPSRLSAFSSRRPDFLHYRGNAADFGKDERVAQRMRELFGDNGQGDSANADPAKLTEEMGRKISRRPCWSIASSLRFLVIHGDADPLVPLQQSEILIAALKKAGGQADLIVKHGGGHAWLTINEEVKVMADWFDKELKEPSAHQ